MGTHGGKGGAGRGGWEGKGGDLGGMVGGGGGGSDQGTADPVKGRRGKGEYNEGERQRRASVAQRLWHKLVHTRVSPQEITNTQVKRRKGGKSNPK